LRCAVAEKRNWKEEMPRFLLNYRTSPHSSTGKAPATLLFGRSLRTRLPQLQKEKKVEEVRNKDLKSKSRMKKFVTKRQYTDKSRLGITYYYAETNWLTSYKRHLIRLRIVLQK
jgi:hypothetical protein